MKSFQPNLFVSFAAVLAAAHDEVGDGRLFAVGGAADDDAPAGVAVLPEEGGQIEQFHGVTSC